MAWKWIKSADLVVGLAILAIGFMLGFNYYKRKNVETVEQSRQTIFQESSQQTNLSFNLSTLFLDYESAVFNYIKNPNPQTLNGMLTLGTKLADSLNQTSNMYGLNVKRWVDLFRVWQYYAEQKLQQAPDNEKKKIWDNEGMGLNFLTYQRQINNQINISQQDYNNDSRDILLYGDNGLKQADPKTQARIDSLYNQKANQLLPQEIQDLKEHKDGIMSCANSMISDFDDPKGLATMIAFIQYQSRYCGFMVRSKTETFCNKTRRLPPIDEKKNMLNERLAVCQIAEKRLQSEKEAAQQKYGHLAYNDYFAKYVAPLVPKYTKLLQAQTKDQKSRYYACNPAYLPVVDFRNPEVDAQIAAYEISSATICHAYFANSRNDFEMQQATNYLLQSRTQKPGLSR